MSVHNSIIDIDTPVAQGYSQHLIIGRSLVRFPWSACQSVLGQDAEQTAPDVLVSPEC